MISPFKSPAFSALLPSEKSPILTPCISSSRRSGKKPIIASCTLPNSRISSIIFFAILEGTANE